MLQGDVQTAVSVMIVLGDKIRPHVDELAQEQWFMSYIGKSHSCIFITL